MAASYFFEKEQLVPNLIIIIYITVRIMRIIHALYPEINDIRQAPNQHNL